MQETGLDGDIREWRVGFCSDDVENGWSEEPRSSKEESDSLLKMLLPRQTQVAVLLMQAEEISTCLI